MERKVLVCKKYLLGLCNYCGGRIGLIYTDSIFIKYHIEGGSDSTMLSVGNTRNRKDIYYGNGYCFYHMEQVELEEITNDDKETDL